MNTTHHDDANAPDADSRNKNSRKIDWRTLPPLDEKQQYTIEQCAAFLKYSISFTHELIADGTIPVIKRGKRNTRISGHVIAAIAAGEQPPSATQVA